MVRTTLVIDSAASREAPGNSEVKEGSKRIGFKNLQPADVLFFGSRGPSSKGSQIYHTAIYVGNGWFIQSSDRGVALAQLTGWYRQKFAWGRRPLREAGLEP